MDTQEANWRKIVVEDISVLQRSQIISQEHPLIQRYNRLFEKSKQLLKEEKQQLKLRYDAYMQKITLARAQQREQEKLAHARQQEQQKIERVQQEIMEKLIRAEQAEQNKLLRKEQQQREEQFIQQLHDQEQAAEQRAWRTVLLQDAAWKAQPEEIIDPAENAEKAAALGEQQLSVPSTITDDYVEQLLNFYNKLDPMGTGTIQ